MCRQIGENVAAHPAPQVSLTHTHPLLKKPPIYRAHTHTTDCAFRHVDKLRMRKCTRCNASLKIC